MTVVENYREEKEMRKKSIKRVSLILMLAFACTAMTACGSKQDQQQPAAGGDNTEVAVSDTLIFAQGAEPRGLDPALVDDGESSKVIVNIYEGLLKFAEDSTEVQACLAKDWVISDDGLTYTFHLQEGVKFHDGTDFNAEAVKFNIERQTINKTEDMGYADFVWGDVASVEAQDDYTVVITLKKPSTPFLNNLAMSLGAPMVSPTALQENDNNLNKKPVGTGPYTFDSWTPDQDIILKKNADYWGEPAKTDTVLFKFIKENASRVVALTNNEADMIDGIDTNVIEELKNSGMEILDEEGMNISYMAYNVERAPFDDPAVRRAISQAINVPEMVEGLYSGYASLANTILPSFVPGYSADVTQISYDPDAAKEALAAAGVTKINMITYSNPRPYNTVTGQPLAEAVQGYLEKVGVEVEITPYDWTTYKEKIKNRDFDICFYGWIGDNGDPDNFMNLLADDDPTMNVAMYQDEEFNALLAKAASTPNGEERNAIYAQMEQKVADEAVWLPISHMKSLSAYNPAVDGYYYHVTGNVFFQGMSKPAK